MRFERGSDEAHQHSRSEGPITNWEGQLTLLIRVLEEIYNLQKPRPKDFDARLLKRGETIARLEERLTK